MCITSDKRLCLVDDTLPHVKPENWCNEIAVSLANELGCGFVMWNVVECAKSERLKLNCRLNRDPNYITNAEVSTAPFSLSIADHVLRCQEVCVGAHLHNNKRIRLCFVYLFVFRSSLALSFLPLELSLLTEPPYLSLEVVYTTSDHV